MKKMLVSLANYLRERERERVRERERECVRPALDKDIGSIKDAPCECISRSQVFKLILSWWLFKRQVNQCLPGEPDLWGLVRATD